MPVKPVPEGYHTVTPYLIVKGAEQFIAFMTEVFGATVIERLMRDGRIGHAELRIGDSVVMLTEGVDGRPAMPAHLYFYIEDTDAAFGRAVKAGATVISPPADQYYGDRSCGVTDPCGNTLWISTHIEDVPPEELQRRSKARTAAK